MKEAAFLKHCDTTVVVANITDWWLTQVYPHEVFGIKDEGGYEIWISSGGGRNLKFRFDTEEKREEFENELKERISLFL